MDYQDYLNSDEWKELRKQAYRRSKNRCELCNNTAHSVHHIKYPKHYSQDKLKNLLVVCDSCHNKLHGLPDGIDTLKEKIKQALYDIGIEQMVICKMLDSLYKYSRLSHIKELEEILKEKQDQQKLLYGALKLLEVA